MAPCGRRDGTPRASHRARDPDQHKEAPISQQTTNHAGVPLHASLRVDSDRLEAMWRMSVQERDAAARRGELSLGEMLKWAARYPDEPAIVNGELFFLIALTPEIAELDESTRR